VDASLDLPRGPVRHERVFTTARYPIAAMGIRLRFGLPAASPIVTGKPPHPPLTLRHYGAKHGKSGCTNRQVQCHCQTRQPHATVNTDSFLGRATPQGRWAKRFNSRQRQGAYTTNAGVPKTPCSISWFKNTSRTFWPKSSLRPGRDCPSSSKRSSMPFSTVAF
jgi:hypothetical protein